jgi:hypothetical protein
MDGYQSDSEFSKCVPALKVIAPTSQLTGARRKTQLRLPGQLSKQLPNELPTQIRSRDQESDQDSSTNDESGSFPAGGLLVNVDSNPGTDQAHASPAMLWGLPSWLVSLVAHLSFLLILAFCTIGSGNGDWQIALEFSESVNEPEIVTLDITVEDVELEDTFEPLVAEQNEAYQPEPPPLSLSMIHEFAEIQTSHIDLTRFEGVASAAVMAARAPEGKQGKTAEFFGATSYGSQIVFVIDCSSSMEGSRWYRAVKELIAAVDELDKGQEFLVLLYNTRTKVMLDTDPRSAALIRATGNNKSYFKRWIRQQRTEGGTFPAHSMYLALSLRPDAIYLLSDGELQDQTVRMLRFWNVPRLQYGGSDTKTPIHTISLGGGRGQMTMMTIAEQNNGTFSSFR